MDLERSNKANPIFLFLSAIGLAVILSVLYNWFGEPLNPEAMEVLANLRSLTEEGKFFFRSTSTSFFSFKSLEINHWVELYHVFLFTFCIYFFTRDPLYRFYTSKGKMETESLSSLLFICNYTFDVFYTFSVLSGTF